MAEEEASPSILRFEQGREGGMVGGETAPSDLRFEQGREGVGWLEEKPLPLSCVSSKGGRVGWLEEKPPPPTCVSSKGVRLWGG